MFEVISVKGSPNQHNRFGLSKTEEERCSQAWTFHHSEENNGSLTLLEA